MRFTLFCLALTLLSVQPMVAVGLFGAGCTSNIFEVGSRAEVTT